MPIQPHRLGLLTLAALAALPLLSGCSREAVAQKVPALPLQYLGAWGVKGSDPGQLDSPAGIATDARGNVYIADAGTQYVEKFAQDGTPMLAFQDDHLKHPQSIAVDRGGGIYVSDPSRASVFVFFPEGDRYREIRLKTKTNVENTLNVTVADDGSMSVLDTSTAKVFDFSSGFRLQRTWQPVPGSNGGSGRPRSVVAGPGNALYVGGMSNNAIQRYEDGKLTAELGANALPAGAKVGDQLAVTNNFIFVTDPEGRALHVWGVDGKAKLDVDLTPELGEGGRLAPPMAVSPLGELLLLDIPRCRVLRYRLNLEK